MNKSTDRITTEQEFSKLEQTLVQTADDAVNCLGVLKGNLADFDRRHGLHFGNTSKFYMRGAIRAAKDSASELRAAANQIAECETPTESEITATRSALNATSDVMNELREAARMYEKKRPEKEERKHQYTGAGIKKVGSEGILRAPDTVEEVVDSTLRDCFSWFATLKEQISTAEKSLSPLFAERSNEAAP
uniref:BAR domain-containing protein n=1 Tax=Phytophthora ramorum TaxID=164328 RepID=H3H131_PHYRM